MTPLHPGIFEQAMLPFYRKEKISFSMNFHVFR
jgi:hypothetical protein